MRRRTILLVTICAAVLAGLLPPIAISYLLRVRAVESQRLHLDEYAQWTLTRADRTLADVRNILTRAEALSRRDCSREHIAQMRTIVMDAQDAKDIGFFRDGRLACTSLGMIDRPIARPTPDAKLSGGFTLALRIEPQSFESQPMMALGHGDYVALIQPGQLIDVLTNSHMTLGIATAAGRPIALSGPVDAELLHRLSLPVMAGEDDRHIFASRRSPDLIAFAIGDRDQALGQNGDDYVVLFSIGLALSALLIGMVVWVSRQRLSPATGLAIAIRKRKFVVHYQPIIELATGRCVAAEALLRWRDPDGRWIPPDSFIPLAEETGLIAELTDLMIDRVVEDMARPLRSNPDLHISINISAGDMESGRFLPVLAQALKRSGVAASQIWLEVTERGFMRADAATAAVATARAAGHMVTIDDFGTGYSSLSLLESLPLDALKIDKSFVDAIAKDAAISVVTSHIIDMAHGLGFHIVAEGVETPEQEDYLRGAGVQFAQGWLYSKPLPAREFEAFRQGSGQGRLDRADPALFHGHARDRQ